MQKSELEAREEVRNLYIIYGRVRWEKSCLLILSLLPSGKFASKMFIYDMLLRWLPIKNSNNKKHLKFISKALYNLYRKKLVVRDVIDINKMGVGKFKQFCDKNKEGVFVKSLLSKGSRPYLVFRLPIAGEKVRLTIPQEKIVSRMFDENSAQKK